MKLGWPQVHKSNQNQTIRYDDILKVYLATKAKTKDLQVVSSS
ncbi:hypothetical protein [Pedobacter quisquiliarum]|nr:hypothetical protein [Pedobacter quisquiliarum]